MAESSRFEISKYIAWLRGGGIYLNPGMINYPVFARCVVYVVRRGGYHRERLCRGLVFLSAYAPKFYRDVAWALIQQIPLSHLLYIPRVIKRPSKENRRRLRHAIVTKIANCSEDEIFRAFFMSPKKFRILFRRLKLPQKLIDGVEIKNKNYLLAVYLSRRSISDVMREMGLGVVDIVRKYRIPVHVLMNYLETPKLVEEVAWHVSPDDFFRHARWFRSIIGEKKFREIAMGRIKGLRDPMSLLMIEKHLRSSGALDDEFMDVINKILKDKLDNLLSKHKIESVAIVVDKSGSMDVAIDTTRKLYFALSKLTRIMAIVAFDSDAYEVSVEELNSIKPGGMTSIGAGLYKLAKKLRKVGKLPDAILLVSDMCENASPRMVDVLENIYKKFDRLIPIIVIHVGSRCHCPKIKYPYAVIPIDDFHPRILAVVVNEIIRLISLSIEQIEEYKRTIITKPLEEEVTDIELPTRPEESMEPGYLRRLLAGE